MTTEERLEDLHEELLRDREFRVLGHRMVWNEDGNCNVPGMPKLIGAELEAQLRRQSKYYR